MTRSCATCIHAVTEDNGQIRCHRNAPPAVAAGDDRWAPVACWPMVQPADRCGKWAAVDA